MITKAQGASDNNWLQHCDANVNDGTIILYCHIAWSNDNNRQMQGKNVYNSHATIKYIMLLFARCNDNHIAPCYNQQRKYAEFGFGKYIRKGMYIV